MTGPTLPRWRPRALLGATALVVASTFPALAAQGDLGHDVGWPQCEAAEHPAGGSFGIVGVNFKRPFDPNPCLAEQGRWAAGLDRAGVYVNTANPGPTSTNWPAGVGQCVDSTSASDPGCAYEYGRKAASHAFDAAESTLSGTGLDVRGITWWLDVEGQRADGNPGNSWEDDGIANTAVLQGFADALRAKGAPEVGIYSTAFQWGDITQGYNRTTSTSYRNAWGLRGLGSFLEDGPVWFAGVEDLAKAQSLCASSSFTGGERLVAQYFDDPYDGDVRCAKPDTAAPTARITAPAQLVSSRKTLTVSWTGTDTGGSDLATFDVQYQRAASNGGFTRWLTSAAWQRTAARTVSVPNPPPGYTQCYQVRARDAAGNVSGWSPSRCTAAPLDDRALTASTGWTRAAASSYYASTYSQTTRRGATLTRTGLQTTRLHLVGLRCSTCGRVDVYVNDRLIKTVDLRSGTTSLATIALPRVPLRTAKVTLKVATSGKLVRIDGLATSRV